MNTMAFFHYRIAKGILVVLASASPPVFAQDSVREARLPDTRAGRLATAYVAAFNSGDREKVREFEMKFRANAPLLMDSLERRITNLMQMHEKWGTLRVDGVFEASDLDLTVGVMASASNEFLRFRFQLEGKEPFGVYALNIERGLPQPERVVSEATPLDAETRQATVNRIAKLLKALYVFPEAGEKMADVMRKNMAEGAYDGFTRAEALATRLTDDLRDICHDKHLRIRAGHLPGEGEDDAGHVAPWEKGHWDNYGFETVKRLPGNIGYIKFNYFSGDPSARPTASAAMDFVRHTDALIFDLRQNGGGSPDMIVHLSNYLFDQRTHLNSFYNRREDTTSETWTSDVPPTGGRYDMAKPVYVLTSRYTFSGAEEFTYNLKNLKRATIVGESSGGGAHPVDRHRLNEQFVIMVPYARAINPVTKTNWEGVGVSPDIDVPADQALDAARRDALQRLISAAKDERLADKLKMELQQLTESSTKDSERSSTTEKTESKPDQDE